MQYLVLSLFLLSSLCKTVVSVECDSLCGSGVYRGVCNQNSGRCRCFYGWTGPNAVYVVGTINEIDADYCHEACHYTHHVRNTSCALEPNLIQGAPNGVPPPAQVPCHKDCNVYLGHPHNEKCLPDGRCLCHYGWTGPNAKFINDNEYGGAYIGLANKIVADYCSTDCHYNHDVRNEECVQL